MIKKPYKINKLENAQDIERLDNLLTILFTNAANNNQLGYKLVKSTILSADQTTIDIEDLDGDKNVEYMIVSNIIGAINATLFLRINDDTGTNYIDKGVDTQTSISHCACRTATPSHSVVYLSAKSGVRRIYNGYSADGDLTDSALRSGAWKNTADNIISIQIASATADCIGIGTRIDIYARK